MGHSTSCYGVTTTACMRSAGRITGHDADAADAAQEAMIAIVRNLDRFDGRSSFGTWVYRIATNASLDELRRRKRRAATDVRRRRATAVTSVADPDGGRRDRRRSAITCP